VMPAGGSKRPASEETVREGLHTLDVPDPDGMKTRLGPVSLPAYLSVADSALDRSGFDRDDLDYVALTHMKRSFHDRVLDELGLDPAADGYYLDEYGHVQSVDQALALSRGVETGRLEAGDLVCLLARPEPGTPGPRPCFAGGGNRASRSQVRPLLRYRAASVEEYR